MSAHASTTHPAQTPAQRCQKGKGWGIEFGYQRGACMNLMIQKQTAKLNIAAAIVKPTCLRMRASNQ